MSCIIVILEIINRRIFIGITCRNSECRMNYIFSRICSRRFRKSITHGKNDSRPAICQSTRYAINPNVYGHLYRSWCSRSKIFSSNHGPSTISPSMICLKESCCINIVSSGGTINGNTCIHSITTCKGSKQIVAITNYICQSFSFCVTQISAIV